MSKRALSDDPAIPPETQSALKLWVVLSRAHASISSVALAEFQAVVIDGIFPGAIRSRLVARVRHHVAALDCRGLPPFEILEGTIGSRARAIGGASLPLLAKFMRDHGLLVREPVDGRA